MKNKKTINVIIKQGNLGENDIIAFDLDTRCNLGMIYCIDKTASGEASMDYFNNCKKPDEGDAVSMIQFLEKTYDCKVNRRYKLTNKDTEYIWSKVI